MKYSQAVLAAVVGGAAFAAAAPVGPSAVAPRSVGGTAPAPIDANTAAPVASRDLEEFFERSFDEEPLSVARDLTDSPEELDARFLQFFGLFDDDYHHHHHHRHHHHEGDERSEHHDHHHDHHHHHHEDGNRTDDKHEKQNEHSDHDNHKSNAPTSTAAQPVASAASPAPPAAKEATPANASQEPPTAPPAAPADTTAGAVPDSQAPLAARDFEDYLEYLASRDFDDDLDARGLWSRVKGIFHKTPALSEYNEPNMQSTGYRRRSFLDEENLIERDTEADLMERDLVEEEDLFERDFDQLDARFPHPIRKFKGWLHRKTGSNQDPNVEAYGGGDPSMAMDSTGFAGRSFLDEEDLSERDAEDDLMERDLVEEEDLFERDFDQLDARFPHPIRKFKGWLHRKTGSNQDPNVEAYGGGDPSMAMDSTGFAGRSFLDEEDLSEREAEDLMERDLYDEEDLLGRDYFDEEDLMARGGGGFIDGLQSLKNTFAETRDLPEDLDVRGFEDFELEELD